MPAVSQRKIEANRLNASKSTGPKTDQGKARSSQNAVTHGLTAASPVVLDEDPAEFQAFAAELRQDLRPRTAMQRVLVDRIVFVSWKLRRIPAIEAAHVEQCKDFVSSWHSLDPQRLTATQVLSHEACQAYFARLQMYEMRLERSLHASLRQLEKLKKIQQNEATEGEEAPIEVEEASVQNEATGAGKPAAGAGCDRIEYDPTPPGTAIPLVGSPCHDGITSSGEVSRRESA